MAIATHSGPVIFGEVLFDQFPDGKRVLGGAPFNVAWHLQAFGLSPLFISRVGDDPGGRQIRQQMLDWRMNTAALQLDSEHPTGLVDISFDNGEPHYEIVENSAWDFIDPQCLPAISAANKPILYHGSLALRNPPTKQQTSRECLKFLHQLHDFRIFVDINLRPPWWSLTQIQDILIHATYLKVNLHELAEIVPDKADTQARIDYLLSLEAMQLLIVTMGEQGAMAITRQGDIEKVVPEHVAATGDVVGAGDAFSSIIILGIYQQWPLATTLHRAQEFASKIVAIQGATTQNKHFYQTLTDAWT
ncbi:MAG: carbohydrate kinase [Gammaproteobacteria bacterium]|nr:carbohydrate kinase [Gammaproteobacteria bacterium]